MIHIVTIKQKIQLYKNEEPANAIELLQIVEYGYELISAKDRFQVGDKALLVEPDYNLPDTEFWKDWTAPGGDPKKSKLGSHNRIRAVKFNLHRGDGMPVYSNGILLALSEAEDNFEIRIDENTDLVKLSSALGIYKYETPERNQGGTGKAGASREFPQGLYKTDEVNFNKVNWTFPIHLVGMVKMDGSSISIGVKNGRGFICSRNLEKPVTYKKKTGFKHGLLYKFLSYFGYNRAIYTEVESESEFVKIGKPYMDKLVEVCSNPYRREEYKNLVLRGELVGQGASNGSGNKNNPHSKLEPQVFFFGVDNYDSSAKRLDFYDFMGVIGDLNFKHPDIVFDKLFESREELLKTCEEYFANNMIEGIVVRSLDGKLSSKILSLAYDSKK